MDKPKLTAFSASGILGSRNYHLELDGSASIIVGPNGTGKSTFLSLFYLMISRQWHRLNEYDFNLLTLHHSQGKIELTKADLLTFESATPKLPTADRIFMRLRDHNAFDLVYKKSLNESDKKILSSVVGIPLQETSKIQRYLQNEFSFLRTGVEIDNKIRELDIGTILYLPTYRRIEKDIKSIFPDIENRLRDRFEFGQVAARTGRNFREIASFGMSDIQKILDEYTTQVKDHRRLATEKASQEYIRDIVRGKLRNYSLTNLRRISESDFDDFKNSLDDKLLTQSDHRSLRIKIDELRERQSGKPQTESRILGMFVEKLLEAHQSVKAKERPLRIFSDILSRYLGPDKKITMEDYNVKIVNNDPEENYIPLDKLSSGEKQIVSIFAYLLLSGENNFVLLIDEPELSLSVPWQKSFLPDVIKTSSCAQIVSVTHSPYVFDNELRNSVVDVRRLKVSYDG